MSIKKNKYKTALVYVDKENKETEIGDYLGVVAVTRNLSIGKDDRITLEKRYCQFSEGSQLIISSVFDIYSNDISDLKEFIKCLFRNHYYISQKYLNDLLDYIIKGIKNILNNGLENYEHDFLGLKTWNGDLYYFAEETLLKNGKMSKCVRPGVKFKSGDEQTYFKMLEDYVYPNTELSVAFAIGLSSLVNTMLLNTTSINNSIWNFYGSSSTGKTTAAIVSLSAFGDCNPNTSKLMLKLNSTKLGLTSQLQNMNGLPYCLDDATNIYKGDIAEEIYTLASGTPRTTSSVNNQAITREGWSGAFIITSETSILDDSNRKSGMDARVIGIDNAAFTKSAEDSDAIREICCENYGWVGEKLGQYMCSLGTQTVIKDFKRVKQQINNAQKKKDKLSSRIGDKYAAVILAAQYYNTYFNKTLLNVQKIQDFLLQNEEKLLVKRDVAYESVQCVFQYFIQNRNNFKKFQSNEPYGKCLGIYRYVGDYYYVSIPSNIVDEIMRQNKFPQYKNYIKEWLENGYIKQYKSGAISKSKELKSHYTFIFKRNEVEVATGLKDDDDFEINNKKKENSVKVETPVMDVDLDDSEAIDAIFSGNDEENSNKKVQPKITEESEKDTDGGNENE